MPSYTITQSHYFETVGPFERPLTHLLIESTEDYVSPAPPLTSDPGEPWLCLLWSFVGGRHVGLFGTAGDAAELAVMAPTNVEAITELRRWLRLARRYYRVMPPQDYLDATFTLWVLPTPFPQHMGMLLQDIAALRGYGRRPELGYDEEEAIEPSPEFLRNLDELFDLGAMFWRLAPGHRTLELETRFVGQRDLERHLTATAKMAGVDLYPKG